MISPVPKPVPVTAAAAHPHHSLIPRWLAHLGGVGLFAVAVLDSCILPLPIPGSTDLLLLWLVSHRGDALILVTCATAGSVIGGYTAWASGKRGGEAALQRYGSSPFFRRISTWVRQHSVLAVFVPALLPPPMPMSMFLIAAGALGISRNRFALVFGVARALRYSLVAWLAVTYGRHMVRVWSTTLNKWSGSFLWIFVGLTVCGVVYGLWQFRRTSSQPALSDA